MKFFRIKSNEKSDGQIEGSVREGGVEIRRSLGMPPFSDAKEIEEYSKEKEKSELKPKIEEALTDVFVERIKDINLLEKRIKEVLLEKFGIPPENVNIGADKYMRFWVEVKHLEYGDFEFDFTK